MKKLLLIALLVGCGGTESAPADVSTSAANVASLEPGNGSGAPDQTPAEASPAADPQPAVAPEPAPVSPPAAAPVAPASPAVPVKQPQVAPVPAVAPVAPSPPQAPVPAVEEPPAPAEEPEPAPEPHMLATCTTPEQREEVQSMPGSHMSGCPEGRVDPEAGYAWCQCELDFWMNTLACDEMGLRYTEGAQAQVVTACGEEPARE